MSYKYEMYNKLLIISIKGNYSKSQFWNLFTHTCTITSIWEGLLIHNSTLYFYFGITILLGLNKQVYWISEDILWCLIVTSFVEVTSSNIACNNWVQFFGQPKPDKRTGMRRSKGGSGLPPPLSPGPDTPWKFKIIKFTQWNTLK